MEKISEAHESVLKILGKAKHSDDEYRLIKYCAQTPVDEGMLLFHLLTRELLLLTDDEYAKLTELDYLKEHWFVVPENLDEKKHADMLRWVQQTTYVKPQYITTYVILPTTDCNAHCFYCFEKGRSRIPMSEETARKTAHYIIEHCGGEKVRLSWLGGEPLLNLPVIDLICDELRREGIAYVSDMTSNGYLFNDSVIQTATALWNLQSVQITLDGTEEVYNRSKAYVHSEESPYQVVLSNVERLLDAKIDVRIRLNIDLYNAENLLTLVEELAERFAGRQGLYVYAKLLFDMMDSPKTAAYTDEEWTARYEALHRLEDRIAACKLAAKRGIKKKLKLNHCMADSGNSVLIAPTGDVGLCECQTDSGFMAHIDREGFDADVVASWKERAEELPECANCFYYPACIRLKKCAVSNACFRQVREHLLRSTQLSMIQEYQLWRNKAASIESEDVITT